MTDQCIEQKIEEGLHEIRPNIQMDGGDIHVVRFEDGVLYIKLEGLGTNCPTLVFNLCSLVEETLRQYVPDLREVVKVADESLH
jgi:Fe-S cluster biogenesis protein NfuA